MSNKKDFLNSELIRNFQVVSQKLNLESKRKEIVEKIKLKRKIEEPEQKKDKKKEKKIENESIDLMKDHAISWDDLISKHELNKDVLENGLSASFAEKRLETDGPNTLSEKKKTPWFILLIKELSSPFALMLWAGSALCFIAYGLDKADPSNLYLGIVLSLVVFITGLVTYLQNAKSDSIMASFKNFIPQKCTIIRDGKEDSIDATKLVRGDVVKVISGERIPADLRIIESKDMRVDNSSLTGESEPLLRSNICDTPNKILESKNVCFFGTLCKEGRGKGIVINVGDNTVIGQIASLSDSGTVVETPLRRELNRFIKTITIIALILGVIFFCSGFGLGYGIISNLVFAIGIIVANVPEGLLATITITLTVAATKLGRKKVLVKNLESVETLGSTSCICSDKTGTLTQNKMTVEHLWYNSKIHKGHNLEKHGPTFSYEWNKEEEGFRMLHDSAIINSTALFSSELPERLQQKINNLNKNSKDYENQKKKIETNWLNEYKNLPYSEKMVIGDASETALVKFFQPINDIIDTRNKYTIAKQLDGSDAIIPFNSAHKFTIKVSNIPNQDYNHMAYLKGAPERVWQKCKYILVNGKEELIDNEFIKKFDEANKYFAMNGERVLGFAYQKVRNLPTDYKFDFKGPYETGIPDEYCFSGLISLIDPPRDSVPTAIEKCKTAGIKVIMVTGDQQLTAASIAKKIGIFDDKSSIDVADELGISNEKAIEECDCIVVNGDMLTQAELEDTGLPEEEKGKKLEKWLKKPQIVFARTSPSQKLYIVKGCQKLGYIVAVTGDGVNDSPAIKQADIGIAMGITGTDVAKDSADMILLNDDFGSIVIGIEEGRKIFDNLKKSIAYTLTSNIPEIIPFIVFIIIQIPLPLSTVLILCVDLGTDIFPAVSFAYEDSELDIMTRLPRPPYEHLVSSKLFSFSYLQMGFIQTFGCFISYFMIMNEFGFKPSSLLYMLNKEYFQHNPEDIYNPTDEYFGNTNVSFNSTTGEIRMINDYENRAKGTDGFITVDWLFTNDQRQDLRMGYLWKQEQKDGTFKLIRDVDWGECRIPQISPMSDRPVCYSTEALKYAQTAFFFCIIITQFSNSLCCKTRKLSITYQGMRNYFMIFGWASEMVLSTLLAYVHFINIIFGTRDLIFIHYCLPAIPFSILMLIYDEARKYLIRRPSKGSKPNWFARNCLW